MEHIELKDSTRENYYKAFSTIEKKLRKDGFNLKDVDNDKIEFLTNRLLSIFCDYTIQTIWHHCIALLYVAKNEKLTHLHSAVLNCRETLSKGNELRSWIPKVKKHTRFISEENWKLFLEHHKNLERTWDKLTVEILCATLYTGIRLSEWLNVKLIEKENDQAVLKVRNSRNTKYSDNSQCTSYGEFRHITIEHLRKNSVVMDSIDKILKTFSGYEDLHCQGKCINPVNGRVMEADALFEKIQNCAIKLNRGIFVDESDWITAKSCRHQFVANLKQHKDSCSISTAILLGNKSPKTAQIKHALTKNGWPSITDIPNPCETDIQEFFEAHKNNRLVTNKQRIKWGQKPINNP